jgi:hypothetical protein
MPFRGKKKKGGKARSRFIVKYEPVQKELASSVSSYWGPIAIVGGGAATDCKTVLLDYTFACVSNASGLINDVFSNNPDSATSWSIWAGIYIEYRTLGFQVFYRPANQYNRISTTVMPLMSVIDRDYPTALVSYDNASQFASCKFNDLSHPWTRSVKMADVSEAVYQPTGTPQSLNYLKMISVGNSLSTTYGIYLVKVLVQFRGIGT